MNRPNQGHKNTTVMATHLPLSDREQFEREIHDLFTNGDLTHIARYMHRDQAAVSKAFNPYDETRHNPVFEFLRVLWAMDCHRDGLADAVLTIVTREREKWLADGIDIIHAPGKLTGNVGRQLAEAVEQEIAHADLDTQIKEWGDVRDSADEKISSLLSQRRESFGVRDWAKTVVNGNGRR